MLKIKRILKRRMISFSLAVCVFAGLFGVAANPVKAESITFKTQVGGIFDGMPLFDGNPDHLDAFVDTYYDYIGLEGACLYATGIRDNYTFVWDKNPNKGKTVPGGLAAADNVQGVSTDFPAIVGMGQSWNKDLVAEIGQVMGSEKISELNVKQGFANIHNGPNASKPIAFTVLHDLRINPLSGRFDEGYSEDPYFSDIMIDEMATGLSGINMEGSEGGFWQRAVVGTKHYSVYNAQWYRTSVNNSASARAIYEYQTRSALRGLASGAVSGVMTSFGRTNGIPNITAPAMIHADKYAKYGLYSSPDFNGENHLYGPAFASEYDERYVPDRKHALALMVLAHSESVRAMGTDKTDVIALVEAVEEGLYGITHDDVKAAGRPLVNQLVRIGIFNEVDENGIPKNYPFTQYAKDVANSENLTDYHTKEHQNVAMQAARESIVLLKNENNALPLSKDEAGIITGIYANSRFKTQYSIGSTPTDIADSGMTPLNAITKSVTNSDDLTYLSGTKVVALKSLANGKYVTAPAGEITEEAPLGEGGQLVADCEETNLTDQQYFNVYDWGQEGYSLFSQTNNRWVTSPTSAGGSGGWGQPSVPPGSKPIENTNKTVLAVTDNTWDNIDIYGASSSLPPVLRNIKNDDDTISIVTNSFATGFSSDFATTFYQGFFVTADESGNLATSDQSETVAATTTIPDNFKFEETVIKTEGEEIVPYAETKGYAIIFIGANVKHSASEGKDRSTLRMGESDYKLVKNVSAAFAAKGKKTIVVVETNFPVIMEEIQNDPNVDAIVYQPYGGQYDGKALAEILYGDYAPTGRLTATWYADESALAPIDEYSIPLGNKTLTLDQIDPRFTKDMTNADPIETKLTYMYTEAPITYPFGYGLSYSSFEYSNLVAPSSVSVDSPFTVTVDVKNTGSINTDEVVQLYVSNPDSAYGKYAPKKKLASFEKVNIAPGETKKVTLTVEPQDFAVWDVNLGDFAVESGTYNLMIGASSKDIRLNKVLNVNGTTISALDATNAPTNVFDHSFASHNVVYREVSKIRTIESLREDKVVGSYYAVMSKGNGAWVALNNVDLTGTKSVTLSVYASNPASSIEIHVDSPDGALLADVTIGETPPPATRDVIGCDYKVTEVDYKDVTVDLTAAVEGRHNLYIVFKDADTRVDSIKLNRALAITTTSLSQGRVGSSYSQTLTSTGGTAPFSWQVKGLPAGLTLNETTGIISGTPTTSGTYSVTITLADGEGTVAEETLSIYIRSRDTGGSGGGGGTAPTVPTEPELEKPEPVEPEPKEPAIPAKKFNDLAGFPWAAKEIEELAAKGIIKGTSENTFEPGKNIIRADFMLLLVTALELEADVDSNFTDVSQSAYYAKALGIAKKLGIASGVGDGSFNPKGEISRQDLMVLAFRALKSIGKIEEIGTADDLKGFADASQVSGYAVSSVATLIKQGIIKGDGTNINPKGTATRAEAAAIIYRILDLLN